jgi:hypothetical protein
VAGVSERDEEIADGNQILSYDGYLVEEDDGIHVAVPETESVGNSPEIPRNIDIASGHAIGSGRL